MEARALLQAAKRGDARALEALCALYHPRLCRYAYALTRSREAAEDVAQDTLVAMLRALPNFRGADAGKFEGWLLRIARNRVYSEARRRKPVPLPEGFDPPDPAPPPGPACTSWRRPLTHAHPGVAQTSSPSSSARNFSRASRSRHFTRV